MKIVFFDINQININAYQNILENNIPNSAFICDSLENIINYCNANAIISPANSYGDMNGGVDRYINEVMNNVEPLVKDEIMRCGYCDNSMRKYLPVGKCIIVKKNNYFLFVTPTMTTPQRLPPNTKNVFMSFYAFLLCYHNSPVNKNIIVLCPCFGTGVGGLNPTISAYQILYAYQTYMKTFY